ncbi:YadA-like family protein [Veillonella magna]|uniref:YadA-like family protein n=1 Tax=Veillonella magna TaxID=464322 RepID=A0ABS2GK58_9FIRM|nr:YadA-like family protein [Veillonella magna]MBM6913549.1 YadA-like family protein [Veillonella magna]
MMKRSQTKKISAMLAAMAVLWGGGTLFFGGDSVSAAVDQAAVLQKVATDGNTSNLTSEEKTWFDGFFSGKTLQSGERALSSTDQVLTENEKKWVSNTYSRVNYDSARRAIKFSTYEPIYLSSMSTTDIIMGNNMNVRMGSGNSTGQAQVYGGNNQFSAYTKVLGDDNIALGNYGITIGYQNDALGNTAIAIGQQSIAGVQWNGRVNKSTSGSNAIAVGTYSFANGNSSAIGRQSMAMGEYSTAFGTAAIAGKSDVVRYLNEVDLWHNYQPQYEELQKRYPEIFGVVTAENLYKNERYEDARNRIFNLYQDYFKSVGIDSLDKLKSQMRDSGVDSLLQDLGWQYALTFDNVIGPVAVGTGSKALANYALSSGYMSEAAQDGSVALGAWSKVTADHGVALGMESESLKEDVVEVEKAPYSGVKLSVNGNGKTGAEKEILRGPVSFGSKLYNDGVQTGTYIRQVQYVADGTHPTDAVNLRQLQGLETKLSQGNTNNTFALAGDIGMTTSDQTVAEKTIIKELGNTINIVGGVVTKTDATAAGNNDVATGNEEAVAPATTPTITEADLTDNNIGVVSDGKDTLTIKLANTLKGITSIEGAAEANGKLSFTTDALTLTRTTGGTTAAIIMGTQGSGTEATPGIHLSYGATKVRIDANGLDVGSKQIHSVQSGMATSASHTNPETGGSTTSSGNADTNNEGTTTTSYTLDVSKLTNDDKRLTNAANIGDLRTAAQGLEEKINDLDTSFTTTVNGLKPITVMGDKEVKNTDGSPKYPKGVITTEAVKDSNNKITGYIVKADLSAYAKKSSLNQYITQKDLQNYIDQSKLDEKLKEYAKLDASNLTDENNINAWKEKLGVTAPPEVKGGSLDYSANGDNTQTIDLDKDGLNFVDGTNTTATVGANGEVKYDLKSNLTGIESIKGKDDTKGKLKFTAEGVELSHQTDSRNNSLSVGNTIQATVGTNSLTVGNTVEAKAGSNSFTLGSDKLETTVGSKKTGSTAMSQTTDTVAWTVTGKATDGKPAPTATVSITAEGLDVGKTRIHNLADGEAPTDAATVGQLTIAKKEFDTHFTKLDGDVTNLGNRVTTIEGDVVNLQNSMNGMNTRITKLDRRVDKVGAGAAALAALHPLDFDPDNKWDIAGGYGHYAGQSAMALGAYYRPNEDVMFSIGGAFGNGEDMINAGMSVKVGSGESKTTTSKAAMAKEIKELRGIVATQQANMEKQEARIQELEKMIQKLVK